MSVVYKCKECGGEIETQENGLGKCLYCGAVQTLPKEKDDNFNNLLNRANDYRLSCDFDRAIYLYEEALKQCETEPEAHWGLFLSKYGVEYVKDSSSLSYKPTLHRISSTSVFDDIDYLAAIKNADMYASIQYKKDAELIEAVLKELLILSNNQEAYDIFISYKEQDDVTKQRTDDSFLAHNLYNELVGKGYKVFFAPKSLTAGLYEPQIYSAIISSKVMIVLGTKPEYFNAVWVKNEWLRFSELIDNGENKIIIPVYKYMDAYDLPNKLAKYQAYNMDDISFLQSLTDIISKYVNKTDRLSFDDNPAAENASLERGFITLGDGDFVNANNFFENALNINPHCAQAYFGKMMVEMRITSRDQILTTSIPLKNFNNFKKALMYADQQFKTNLINLEQTVQDNCNKKDFDRFRKDFNSIKSVSDVDIFKNNYNIEECNYLDDKEYWKSELKKKEQGFPLFEEKMNVKIEEMNVLTKKIQRFEYAKEHALIFKFLFMTPFGWIFGVVTLLWGFIFGTLAGILELIIKPHILKGKLENLANEKTNLQNEIDEINKEYKYLFEEK